MKIFITSGGTKIRIDSVRHLEFHDPVDYETDQNLANMSKGTFGARIATEAMKRGHNISYMISKDGRTPFSTNVDVHRESISDSNFIQRVVDLNIFYINHRNQYHEIVYDEFIDYHYLLRNNLQAQKPDVVILSAAVSDYGVEDTVSGKIQSKNGMDLKFVALPKIISHIKEWVPNCFLVGFKLLAQSSEEELIAAAKASIEKNKCDLVVANDISTLRAGAHEILLVDKSGNVTKYTENLAQAVMEAIEKSVVKEGDHE